MYHILLVNLLFLSGILSRKAFLLFMFRNPILTYNLKLYVYNAVKLNRSINEYITRFFANPRCIVPTISGETNIMKIVPTVCKTVQNISNIFYLSNIFVLLYFQF